MKMTPVKSGHIEAIGYDSEHNRLVVKFHGGKVYEYAGVPGDVHRSLMVAKSIGAYFAQNIRKVFPLASASGN